METQAHSQGSSGGGLIASVLGLVGRSISGAWQALTRDGTVAAIGREMIKDVRSTIHEFFFGKGEHYGEAGAPLNPTQGEVAASRNSLLRSPVEIARGDGPYGPAREQDNAGSQPAEPLRSPSTIAADRDATSSPEQHRSYDHDHGL